MATKSKHTSLRIEEHLLDWIKDFAEFNGLTTNGMITQILEEKMQDDLDYMEGIQSINECKEETTISSEEMMERYG